MADRLVDHEYIFVVKVDLESDFHMEPYAEEGEFLKARTISRMIKEHIQSAVEQWGGQMPPNHLLFPSNIRTVKVQLIKRPAV